LSRRADGPIAVITGGASGIGEACARLLHARGWQPVLVDLDESAGARVAAELDTRFYRADVADESAMTALAARIDAEVGAVSGLINSAGVVQNPLPPHELSMDVWDRVVRIDQRGTYVSCVAFGLQMARRGRGSIVNIASVTGMRSVPLHAYGPAKAAVIAISEGLAGEWGRAGVRVNTVSPGYTRTARVERRFETGERDPTAYRENSALGRMVEPNEIAEACAFLLSDSASGITGVNLPVDCGWLLVGSWANYGGIRKPGATEP
jgi:NAD(P)-dependent dehydrogenase (short-subunit alcohol dehydrogenase family)